jgi:hypothetical protein
MDFGIYHYYPGGGSNNTNVVLNSTDDLPGIFDTLRSRIDTYVGPGASNEMELHMTEFKYFGSVDNAQIDGVYAANTFATVLADGVTSAHWLELSDSSFVGDNAGALVRGGAYHGIQVFSRISETGSEFVQTTSSSGSVEVHSTVLRDGRVGMLIANLNGSGSSNVNVNISGTDLGASGTTWLYGVTQTTPLETQMATGLGNIFTINVPARSIRAVLIDASLPGDYNDDGSVDAADYVVIRQGLGTEYTETDMDLWRAHFGETAGGGSLANAAVPEQGAVVMVFTAGILSLVRRRAGHRRDCGVEWRDN